MKRAFVPKTFAARTFCCAALAGRKTMTTYRAAEGQISGAGAAVGDCFQPGATIGQDYHSGATAGFCNG